MALVRAVLSVVIAVVAAGQSSCGGVRHELQRSEGDQRAARTPFVLAVSSRPSTPAALVSSHHPDPSPAPVPALPIPSDAFAEHLAADAAMVAAFDQRYPLHGIAFHLQAQVFSEPSDKGQVIGYLRRGTRFRAAQGKSGSGCDRAWHELATGGFVCAGRGFTLGKTPQDFDPSPVAALPFDPLPYAYAKNTAKASLQYWRIPTAAEENAALAALSALPDALQHPQASDAPSAPVALPSAAKSAPASAKSTASAKAAPDPAAALLAPLALPDYARMPMQPGFYVSVDRRELADANAAPVDPNTVCPPGDKACIKNARPFVRTVRGAYVPAAALAPVQLAETPSGELAPGVDLPIGIVYRPSAKVFVRDALEGTLSEAARLPRYARVPLTAVRVQHEGRGYLLARSGELVSESELRIAERVVRPPLVPKRARLIHVRLDQQTLVAYDGDRPVFATLVATGKEGFETPPGLYRIVSKHVSATMDGLAGSEDAYSIEDVPFTMYFQGSYALHAAFWHDRFGATRSHGCVNLTPADARFLFRWATPVLPSGWHGVLATRDNPGTWLFVE